MATTEVTRVVSPVAAPSSSRKRKSQADEIEVDLSLPEPPSKKAKRLLKKGKTLPVKPASDDEPGSEDDGLAVPKTRDTKDKKSQRSEHGIWIGNLPFTLTRPELFKWLVECSGGVITEENITRVNLPRSSKVPGRPQRTGDDNKPQNRGFAYVDFSGEAPAVAAMALTETELEGRKVLIKNSKSFDGRPQKEANTGTEHGATDGAPANRTSASASAANRAPSRKIYVGNLGFQTSEDDLRYQFDKCGEIEWVKVATFEDSGKCKGYAWVKFKESEAAEWAVKGFVKIREEIETEDDFRESKDKDEDEAEVAEKGEKKFKMRKWWINRLKGRELKIDYAEDDQSRYKKRFGKEASSAGKDRPRREHPAASNRGERRDKTTEKEDKPRPEKAPAYAENNVASYLTGAVVKPQGKKVTFN
ncbi:hypothetical protein F4778DRAFT_603800 [Xylariomycetidae sp. FL2044]|nr:hypothetical protein F4778DRAFT_603800 [Xylariomycetidae sp. FL2044]